MGAIQILEVKVIIVVIDFLHLCVATSPYLNCFYIPVLISAVTNQSVYLLKVWNRCF